VQTASTLPVVLLAAPAGVLADVLDRRRVLVSVQLTMVAVAGLLAALTATGVAGTAVVLTFTFLLGCGAAFIGPAWQAIQPELVPRRELAQAAALGAVNMNLARAVGPAVGGLLVATAGASVVFGLNAVSFLVVAATVAAWRRSTTADPVGRERMVAALRSGTRYVANAPSMRRILVRSLLFVPIASALWALLPVVATDALGLGANGYGVLLGALGVGAVAGATVLPRIRARVNTNALLGASAALYAVALAALGLVHQLAVALVVLALAGAAWMSVLSSLNATAQVVLPGWVRARALSYYLVVFMGGQALGGALWGGLAEHDGLRFALVTAGVLLLLATVAARWLPLVDVSRLDPTPATHWPEPQLAEDVQPADGPVLVVIDYDVRAGDEDAFAAAMTVVARSRRRTGAQRWTLYRDPGTPGRFVETFSVATWGEHFRQHTTRLTNFDRRAEERAHSFLEQPPRIRHLVGA
jgi:MFS family permease